jgi:hypothetical protein
MCFPSRYRRAKFGVRRVIAAFLFFFGRTGRDKGCTFRLTGSCPICQQEFFPWQEPMARFCCVRQCPARPGISFPVGWHTGPGKTRQSLTRDGHAGPAKSGSARPTAARRARPSLHRWLANMAKPCKRRQGPAPSKGSGRDAGKRPGEFNATTRWVESLPLFLKPSSGYNSSGLRSLKPEYGSFLLHPFDPT